MSTSAGLDSPAHDRGPDRGTTVVCVPLLDQREHPQQCLNKLLAHTAAEVPLIVVERRDSDTAAEKLLSRLDRDIHHVRTSTADGPAGLVSAALAASGDADVLLLAPHALVFKDWLDRMSAAGRSDSTIGTASALGNNAGLLSIALCHDRLASDLDLERLAADLAKRSPQARPRVPAADGHCIWISRAALELIGPLDTAFTSLRAALIDFSQRCVLRGLVNVAADDVIVPSVMTEPAAGGGAFVGGPEGDLLNRRYPCLRRALDERVWPPLSVSLSAARRTQRRLTVTVDARIVRGAFSGAHAETLELIRILAETKDVELRAVLDPAIGPEALATLGRLPEVEQLCADDVGSEVNRSDIVHRPYQVTSPEDLELLPRLGERLVLTHLDLIAYHNPGYFGSFEGWQQHRRVTRQALAMADQAIFLSRHAARDAIREGLIEEDRIHVLAVSPARVHAPLAQPDRAPPGPFLLCIGNDFRHKNRLFAIKLLAELRKRGWNGQLLLVGADVAHGSSREDEASYLESQSELAAVVQDLPSVSEPEKSWLYVNAAAVVYPTVNEGFGLIPYEAARAGTPCLFAPQASLAEVLPADAATLVPWDAGASAEQALPLLRDADERQHHVELLRGAMSHQRDALSIGQSLVEIYDEAIRLPFREASLLAAEAGIREAVLTPWLELNQSRARPLLSLLASLHRIRRQRLQSRAMADQRNA